MRFIKDHVIPRLSFEDVLVSTGQGVRGYTDVERILVVPTSPKLLSPLRSSMVAEKLEARKELLELHLPIEQNTCRDNDEMRSPNAAVASQVR